MQEEAFNMRIQTAKLCLLPAAFLWAFSVAQAQSSIISQVVDGGAWLTTIGVTNISSSQTVASLAFFQETGGGSTSSWNLALQEGSAQAIVVQPGSTVFLHTLGTAAATTVGYGQLTEIGSSGSLAAYAIFTLRGAQLLNGTAPASPAVSRILVPFDNANGAATSMAVVNPTSSSVTINVGVRVGSTTSQPTAITLPANGHKSFDFPTQFGAAVANQSGLAEFYSPSGTFSILALRFQSGAFTTAPVYNVTGPPLIASASSGSGGGGGAGNIIFGGFTVSKSNITFAGLPPSDNSGIGGQFASYTPAEWQLPFSAQTFGPCTVLDVTNPVGGKPPYSPDSFLDAGTISVSGPNVPPGAVLMKLPGSGGPSYFYSPPIGTSLANGGTYTISNGNGGSQIGAFSISAKLPDSFVVTNWDAITAINRGSGLTINWTGGGFDTIGISAIGSNTANGNVHTVSISCIISPAASSGSFSIPSDALAKLPVVQAGSATDTGLLSVTAGTSGGGSVTAVSSTSTALTPPLVGGGQVNYGFFAPSLSVLKNVSIQ
jgi:hypothetical protein